MCVAWLLIAGAAFAQPQTARGGPIVSDAQEDAGGASQRASQTNQKTADVKQDILAQDILEQDIPEQDIPDIKVDVRLVNVFVNVADAAGAPVGGLTRDDFEVSEDGKPQKIAVFERESGVPLSIVLAVDTSGSVHRDMRMEVRAAKDFVHALLRPQDELELLEFDENVRERVPFTNNVKRIDYGLDRMQMGSATALYNAIFLASQTLAARPGPTPRRKVIVLVTDGGDTVKGVRYKQAMEQAQRSEAMVYSLIIVPVMADAGRDTGGEHALIQMSRDTGGKYSYVDQPEDLEPSFAKISEDLRTQYLLGYYPSSRSTESGFRSIEVEMKDPALRAKYSVRSRSGYYAEGQ